jgi:hypothetical protein
VRTCEIEPTPLNSAEAWIAEQRSIWEGRLDRLEAYLHSLQANDGIDGEEA